MRFYKHTHAFYCGVDLHARSMFTHILDHEGNTVFEADLPASPEAFRNAIAPFRAGLVVGCECMFSWYWLADLCEDEALSYQRLIGTYLTARFWSNPSAMAGHDPCAPAIAEETFREGSH